MFKGRMLKNLSFHIPEQEEGPRLEYNFGFTLLPNSLKVDIYHSLFTPIFLVLPHVLCWCTLTTGPWTVYFWAMYSMLHRKVPRFFENYVFTYDYIFAYDTN
jgi:hypothetical protein